MKLKDLESVLYSSRGEIQWTFVYDIQKNEDVECGCSIEYAIKHYGDREVKRISPCYDFYNKQNYLLIAI